MRSFLELIESVLSVTMQSPGVGGSASGEQSIEVSQLGTGATAQLLIDIATRHGYSVVAVGPSRFRLARTKRPTWAVVLACLTAIFALLGLLFLLIRRTETADAVVAETRSGVTVRLTGTVSPELMAELRSTFADARSATRVEGDTAPPVRALAAVLPIESAPASPESVEPTSFQPPAHAPLAPQPIASLAPPMTPFLIDSAMPLDTVVHRPAAAVLHLSTGGAIQVGAGGVIGRDPSADPRVPTAQLHPIPDPSLSKTHLSFGPAPTGIWVVDNYSTNGTFTVVNGAHEMCAPGVHTEVPFGARVLAGDLEMTVDRQ